MMSTIFFSKAVRDLHWAIASPHLLTEAAGVSMPSDEWCGQLCEASMAWLCELDEHPYELEEWLRMQRNVRRLGFYFASLLEFWVRNCPALQSGSGLVLVQQQIHAGVDGEVAGQLKLVFTRCTSNCQPAPEVVHWESHVKFFAWCAAEAGEAEHAVPSCGEGLPPSNKDAAALEGDAMLSQYVGPFLGENFLHRVVELRRKVALSSAPAVRRYLAARFGTKTLAGGDASVASSDVSASGGDASGGDASGGDASGGDASASGGDASVAALSVVAEGVVRGFLFYPLGANWARTEAPCTAVSSTHARGWWTRSIEEALAFFPDALWAMPGSAAAIRQDGYGGVGGKLHWLAPAVALPSAPHATASFMSDQYEAQAAEGAAAEGAAAEGAAAEGAAAESAAKPRPRIRGIASLGVADCPLLDAAELREAVGARHGPSAPPCADAAILLLQLRPHPISSLSNAERLRLPPTDAVRAHVREHCMPGGRVRSHPKLRHPKLRHPKLRHLKLHSSLLLGRALVVPLSRGTPTANATHLP